MSAVASGVPIEVALKEYVPADPFFGHPYVDLDEQRDLPVPHRYLHGGFETTATRFSFYFPLEYKGRFFHYLEGGFGGSENASGAGRDSFGGLTYAASRGGFFVESNQGHKGAEICAKAGQDATVYAYRASAESARLARHLAGAIYGEMPEHGYLFGGSGGGHRTLCGMEHCQDDNVWDAGVASVIGAPGTLDNYAAMNNARRLLGRQFDGVVDAVEPGGSGNPFEDLTTTQREALADLYASGFPRGAERSVPEGLNAGVYLWTWNADSLVEDEHEYFEAFWTRPGYAGADGSLVNDVIDVETTVSRTVTPKEAATYALGGFGRTLLMARPDKRVGLLVAAVLPEAVEGARITFTSGAAAGRVLYCVTSSDGLLIGSGIGEAQTQLFDGVEPNDGVHIDNRDFLAYCYHYRHHLVRPEDWSRLWIDGNAIYPQHPPRPLGTSGSPVFGPMELTGAIRRPVFLLQHTHDTSGWPEGGVSYDERVRARLGERAEDRFRFWWIEHAEHIPGPAIPARSRPAPATRLIDYRGAHEAAMDAMVAWVERGDTPPPSTGYSFDQADKSLRLPVESEQRAGIQPVAIATVNGATRADVRPGEEVSFAVEAQVPSGAGSIVEIAWDFDGSGTWPEVIVERSNRSSARFEARHVYEEPGTYFPAARVISHAGGDAEDPQARVVNLGRCRVVVTSP